VEIGVTLPYKWPDWVSERCLSVNAAILTARKHVRASIPETELPTSLMLHTRDF